MLALGWFVATAIALLTLFGLYGNSDSHPLGKAGNVVYEMFSRFAWGVFLAWVVVACKFGKAGKYGRRKTRFLLFFLWSSSIFLQLFCFSDVIVGRCILLLVESRLNMHSLGD